MLPKGYILLALAIIILALPASVSAHADLLQSFPQSGSIHPLGSVSHVSLHFDEEIEASFSSIEVYSSSLERKDVEAIQQDPTNERNLNIALVELEIDTYTVVWSVVSKIDGHAASGLFTFRVGTEVESGNHETNLSLPTSNAAFSLLEVGIRWLLFSSVFLTFGAFLLIPTVLVPSIKTDDAEYHIIWQIITQSLNRLIFYSLILWILAGFAQLVWQAIVVGRGYISDGLTIGILSQLLPSRFGKVWLLRQVLAFGLFVLHWKRKESLTPMKLALTAGLLASLSLSSHNAAGALWPALATAIDWLHLLSSGAWVGGLFVLVLVFFPALKKFPVSDKRKLLLSAAKRFSKLAIWSVLLSGATGFFSASLHLIAPEDLLGTSYGKTLLIKIFLVLSALLLGLANSIAMKPKWASLLAPTIRGVDHWQRNIKNRIRIEVVFGLFVLLTTATLTALPTPPPQPIPQGQQLPSNSILREIDFQEDHLKVFFTMAPNWTGWNRYLIVLQDEDRNFVSDAEQVRLRFYLPTAEARTDWIVATQTKDGLYVTSGQELLLVGEWQIEIDVRRPNVTDVRSLLNWSMEAPPVFVVDPAKPRTVNWFALFVVVTTLGAVFVHRNHIPEISKPIQRNK